MRRMAALILITALVAGLPKRGSAELDAVRCLAPYVGVVNQITGSYAVYVTMNSVHKVTLITITNPVTGQMLSSYIYPFVPTLPTAAGIVTTQAGPLTIAAGPGLTVCAAAAVITPVIVQASQSDITGDVEEGLTPYESRWLGRYAFWDDPINILEEEVMKSR